MASAIQLTATSTLINGHGLATASTVASNVSILQAYTPITTVANIFSTVYSADANIRSNLSASVNNLGIGVTKGQWLIDFYPDGTTVKCSGTVYKYGNSTQTSSFSRVIQTQSSLPFSHGVQGFANVFQTTLGHASTTFDTISSVYLLNTYQAKTYAQSGIGFTGPVDLATNGIGNAAPLISNVVSTWGTMYDIKNIKSIGNPYVFGQNILNQKLGKYGNLTAQLKSAGLNTNNLLQVPQTSVTVTQETTTTTKPSSLGSIALPTVANVATATVVSGNSTDVVVAIYKSVTGANLQSIVTATNVTFANTSITSLNDYLNLNKIVDGTTYTDLSSLGITDLNTFGSYLQSRIGQGNFKSWRDLATFLSNITAPVVTTTSSPTDPVLSPSTISTLSPVTGSGPFNNFIISDYLGAATGIPYSANLATINGEYNSLSSSISLTTKLNSLKKAIDDYIAAYDPLMDPPVFPDITPVNSNVTAVNNALNSLSPTLSANSQTAYTTILTKLGKEVDALSTAGVVFNAGTKDTLTSFAQRFGTTASDQIQNFTYQFFNTLVTNDANGDTLKSAMAESVNTKLLASKGIFTTNDPSPGRVLTQAQAQGLTVSDYLARNK